MGEGEGVVIGWWQDRQTDGRPAGPLPASAPSCCISSFFFEDLS